MTETPEIPEAAIKAARQAIFEHTRLPDSDYTSVALLAVGAALPHLNPEPTFTASELKKRLETATAVALALGRKEALEEVVGALIAEGATQRAIAIVRSIASQPRQAVSNGLTAPSGHTDLPPTPEASRSPQGES